MSDDYNRKTDDRAFLDFGPEPVDKELYDELVTKELDAAREQKRGKGNRRDNASFSVKEKAKYKKSAIAGRMIAIALSIVAAIVVVYAGASSYIANYYGSNSAINYIKYGGYQLNDDYYNEYEAFDSIDIDVVNCDVSVQSSYDDNFHISYRFFTKDENDVKCEIEQRDGRKVLVLTADGRKNDKLAWDIFNMSHDYDVEQYVSIMVPDKAYDTFKTHTTKGYVSIYEIDGQVSDIEIEAEDDEGSVGLDGISADYVTITAKGIQTYIDECEIGSAVIKAEDEDVSIYNCSFSEMLDADCVKSHLMFTNISVNDGGRIKALTSKESIYLSLSGNADDYSITADAGKDIVYCYHYDYYEKGKYEVGDGSKQVELYNTNESIYIFFEADD